ncbi:MAG: cytochrome ubiquinol oxidase subunit I [Myxococcota bacterium]
MDALFAHRFQFGFTIAYHYLFPQLTMGLAMLIFVLKSVALHRGSALANESARFWTKIFGLNFLMGVVTGIPMEFQFGTNWSRFASAAGGVIGHTLAMEGVFAFFLESAFLYALLFWEERLGPRLHWLASLLVFAGAWISGYFIVCTNAFMQHPVGYALEPDGTVRLESLSAFLTNPWAIVQYSHVMVGSVITASFVMAGIGAFYLLSGRHRPHAEQFVRVGVIAGAISTVAAAFPTGDIHARMVAESNPVAFAAMEGHFFTEEGAPLVLVGQPDMDALKLDNPIHAPKALSFLTHYRWDAKITGLTEFDRDLWPDNVPLVYYGYHVMVGLGTIFIALMLLSLVQLLRRKLFDSRGLLWALMIALPFPYIANTAGWMTTEMGRQPWVLVGLMRTADGTSEQVSVGNVLFTLLGFMGLYALLSVLFLLLVVRLIARGPGGTSHGSQDPEVAP